MVSWFRHIRSHPLLSLLTAPSARWYRSAFYRLFCWLSAVYEASEGFAAVLVVDASICHYTRSDGGLGCGLLPIRSGHGAAFWLCPDRLCQRDYDDIGSLEGTCGFALQPAFTTVPVNRGFRNFIWLSTIYTYIAVYSGALLSHSVIQKVVNLGGIISPLLLHQLSSGLLFVVILAVGHYSYRYHPNHRDIRILGVVAVVLIMLQVVIGISLLYVTRPEIYMFVVLAHMLSHCNTVLHFVLHELPCVAIVTGSQHRSDAFTAHLSSHVWLVKRIFCPSGVEARIIAYKKQTRPASFSRA